MFQKNIKKNTKNIIPFIFFFLAHFLIFCKLATYFLCYSIFPFYSNLYICKIYKIIIFVLLYNYTFLSLLLNIINIYVYTLCLRMNFVFLYANARAYVLANVTNTKEIKLEYRSIRCILQNNPINIYNIY